MNDKHKQVPQAEVDDVDRLFARLGSNGAEGYRDFEPGRLPVREPAVDAPREPAIAVTPEPAAAAAAPDAATTPILATIRPLRPEPPSRLVAVAGADTPLADMFQRLLQAESQPAAAGPLRRMFGR